MRLIVALISLSLAVGSHAQSKQLVDAPQPQKSQSQSSPSTASVLVADLSASLSANLNQDSSSADLYAAFDSAPFARDSVRGSQPKQNTDQSTAQPQPDSKTPVDAEGKPIPLERQQPQRILGFMPNFRSVSGGSKPHPPGWKYDFIVATHQATDYSTFIFLGLTSLTAEGMDMHPSLGKGAGGFYAYTWRGFLDKTDSTYLSAWLLPSLLHEDTRFYALGSGHTIVVRSLYVISRQAVARTYGGRETPNIAGLGGKVLTQVISRYYYPPSATSFPVLASKFGYSVMRDVMFSSIREFYPDIAAHYIRKHREKVARLSAQDVASTQ
ncbi:MAG TPA: hypothetical protein VMW15_03520 [Terracidiphilus sp.]|nr:hypothetical protein [Terracidiphilus sp.]